VQHYSSAENEVFIFSFLRQVFSRQSPVFSRQLSAPSRQLWLSGLPLSPFGFRIEHSSFAFG
jgi:hypothetical protein